jgi:rod shape determining protein RodA
MGLETLRRLDLPTLFLVGVLTALGVVMVYTATGMFGENGPGLEDYAVRQTAFALMGLVLLGLATATEYRFLGSLSVALYALTVLLLVLTFAVGLETHGATRWIDLGLLQFQPSELAKVTTAVAIARYLSVNAQHIDRLGVYLKSVLVLLPIAAMVYLQPDLGTTLVLASIWFTQVFAAGVPTRYLAATAVASVPMGVLAWFFLLKDYMRARLLASINPEADILGQGYNLIQARIAIGSGGLLGHGFTAASQIQLGFLPVQYADFIFAVVGAELGFVGVVLVVSLYFLLCTRLFALSQQAKDNFGRLLVAGVGGWIAFQAFVNMGMNLGLVPSTGIPLPFVSYGGSALISLMIAIGIVQSVMLRRERVR